MSEATVHELLPAKKERTTKVEKVIVQRRTLTVQSRTAAWLVGSVFVAGFALGHWDPPADATTAATSSTVTIPTTSTTMVQTTLAAFGAPSK